MQKFNIKLGAIDDVKEFVEVVARYDFDIDLVSGRYTVDAKSIMGIFSLDLSKPMEIHVHCEDCKDVLNDLDKFIVK